jgi:hypothetical protein
MSAISPKKRRMFLPIQMLVNRGTSGTVMAYGLHQMGLPVVVVHFAALHRQAYVTPILRIGRQPTVPLCLRPSIRNISYLKTYS